MRSSQIKNKQRFISILLFTCVVLGYCKNETNKARDFQNQEIESIQTNVKDILNSLQYEKYNVLVIPHFSYTKTKASERKVIENFDGTPLQGETVLQSPPGYLQEKNQNGHYSRREFTANYDSQKQGSEYNVDYLSILILFDSIGAKDKEKLNKLLEKAILHRDRGDVLEIASKEKPKRIDR